MPTYRGRKHRQIAAGNWASDLGGDLASLAKFASPSGNDSTGNGTFANPYLTVQKLASQLTAGYTGYLRGGTYGSYTGFPGDITVAGTATNPITLTNYPGESVTIRGYFSWLGNYAILRNLHFDCSNDQFAGPDGTQAYGLLIQGSDILFEYNEVLQSQSTKGSGILQGSSGSGTGHRNIYRYNKIHGIGFCRNLDHGIYHGYGDDLQIYGNWLWSNSHGWGFQIYPEAVRASVHGNVIDAFGGGVVISDNGSATCHDNDVYNNIVMNGVYMENTSSGFTTNGAGISGSGPVSGTNNKFRDNDVYNCPDGVGSVANVSITGNITTNPNLQNPGANDYRTTASTPATQLAYGCPSFIVGPTI